MPAHRSFHDAVRNAADRAEERRQAEWTWRSTGDRGLLELWKGDESVGTVSILDGLIERRAVLMNLIVDHLNQYET